MKIDQSRIAVSIILLIPVIIIIIAITSKKQWEMKYSKYKEVNLNADLNSVIVDIIHNNGTWITLKDSTYLICPWADNPKYNFYPPELSYFIKLNDSLSKPKNSHTIFVFRGGEKFEFFLDNKSLKNNNLQQNGH